MKRFCYLLTAIAALLFIFSCKNVNYRKTKSGLLYKIFPSKGKDSLIREGDVVKFNYTISFNDSLMDRFNSYGKMPGFAKLQSQQANVYDFIEILDLMKKGDSAVTVQMVDSIFKSYRQLAQRLPANAKKGDRLVMTIKITDVFKVDSLAQADYNKEMEKDRPRQMKEQEEENAKARKEQEQQMKEMVEKQEKEIEELEKSGEAARQVKIVEDYLAKKNIKAVKTGKGTFVRIDQQGTGPTAENGKFVKVKYTGKILATDSTFQSYVYSFQLGPENGGPIRGWHEGLLLFRQGGKGTLYIPGFLAYGNNPSSPFKPYEALKFDIELQEVSDKPIANE